MCKYRTTLDMTQEVESQALTLAGSRNEARNVRDRERLIIDRDNTQVGSQRCKRIISNFWLRCGHHTNERRFTSRGKANQSDVCEGLELEYKFFLFARLAF